MTQDFDTELAIDITSYIERAENAVSDPQYKRTSTTFEAGNGPHKHLLVISFTPSSTDGAHERTIKFTLSKILEDAFDWYSYHDPYPELLHGTVSETDLKIVFDSSTPQESNAIEPLPDSASG